MNTELSEVIMASRGALAKRQTTNRFVECDKKFFLSPSREIWGSARGLDHEGRNRTKDGKFLWLDLTTIRMAGKVSFYCGC